MTRTMQERFSDKVVIQNRMAFSGCETNQKKRFKNPENKNEKIVKISKLGGKCMS